MKCGLTKQLLDATIGITRVERCTRRGSRDGEGPRVLEVASAPRQGRAQLASSQLRVSRCLPSRWAGVHTLESTKASGLDITQKGC